MRHSARFGVPSFPSPPVHSTSTTHRPLLVADPREESIAPPFTRDVISPTYKTFVTLLKRLWMSACNLDDAWDRASSREISGHFMQKIGVRDAVRLYSLPKLGGRDEFWMGKNCTLMRSGSVSSAMITSCSISWPSGTPPWPTLSTRLTICDPTTLALLAVSGPAILPMP